MVRISCFDQYPHVQLALVRFDGVGEAVSDYFNDGTPEMDRLARAGYIKLILQAVFDCLDNSSQPLTVYADSRPTTTVPLHERKALKIRGQLLL